MIKSGRQTALKVRDTSSKIPTSYEIPSQYTITKGLHVKGITMFIISNKKWVVYIKNRFLNKEPFYLPKDQGQRIRTNNMSL